MEQTTQVIQEAKKGQVFYTSWGYDQTNYDFIVIEQVSPTGKTAKCRMARLLQNKHDGFQAYEQIPSAEGFGDQFRMKINYKDNGEIELRGSYPFCNGEIRRASRLGTFWMHKEGKKYYETDIMYGH